MLQQKKRNFFRQNSTRIYVKHKKVTILKSILMSMNDRYILIFSYLKRTNTPS